MNISRILSIGFVSLVLSACGGSSNDDGDSGGILACSNASDPDANQKIIGFWRGADDEQDALLSLVFFDDGTYLLAQVESGADDSSETSGMEWGKYSRNEETAQLAITEIMFNGDDDHGFSDIKDKSETVCAQIVSDKLVIEFEDDGEVANVTLSRVEAVGNELVGVWTKNTTNNSNSNFLTFLFFPDNTYVHMQEIPGHDEKGMEWGNYTWNAATGELTIPSQIFNKNGRIGLTDFVGQSNAIFAQVSEPVLTLQFDDNADGNIDKELDFQRAF